VKTFINRPISGALVPIVLVFLSIFSGCAHSGGPQNFRSQKGLLAPLENPDSLVSDPSSLMLYLGDVFNSRGEGGTVLYGQRLEARLRKLEGEQVSAVCRSLPCYADAARKLHYEFILSATIRMENSKDHSKGILTITRWSVNPFFPEMAVPITFSMEGKGSSYEKLVDRDISRMMDRIKARSSRAGISGPEGAQQELKKLVAEGKIDLALRRGEAIFRNGTGIPQSTGFYATLYRLEMSAGKPEMAYRIGISAIRFRRASSGLFLEMARNAKEEGNLNRERNILYEGLLRYPENHLFWRELVREYISREEFSEALKIIDSFRKKYPPSPLHPRFRGEVYACLVGLGRGDEADIWYRHYIEKHKLGEGRPSPYLAHAMVSRELQRGEWKKAEKKAREFIAMGVRSKKLYADWMTALGADNNPIGEAHAARSAISGGFGSRWIRGQLAYLEQKGY